MAFGRQGRPVVLSSVDIVVMVLYLVAVVAMGCWFARRSANTSAFMAAEGQIPAWAVGLSIFGTYLSSNTFLGVPGKAYATNWNAFVFSLALPLSAWIATRYFVPFYRQAGEISAYQHLEHRFGRWARTYAVICYLLTQFARIGVILFGVSLALAALTGLDQASIIIVSGILVTLYTVIGGIEAVIWTDVVQSLVLIGGAVLIVTQLLAGMPEGPGQVIDIGVSQQKFSLGSFDLEFFNSTFWVVLLFGVFVNLNNFGIDQSFVQRYHTARNEQQAKRSVWLAAMLYLPISLLFFFIGSATFAFYQSQPEQLDNVRLYAAQQQLDEQGIPSTAEDIASRAAQLTNADVGDQALPYFIVHELPVGVRGLLIAAIFAAAMSSIDTSLNSSATVMLLDIYQRYLRPSAGERESMIVLYLATLTVGVIGTSVAVAMIGVESVLDTWWLLSGIFAGGLLGLFLLGMIARQANATSAAIGVFVGLLTITWLTWPKVSAMFLTSAADQPATDGWSWLQNPLHENMTIVIGTLIILIVGTLATRFQLQKPGEARQAPDANQ